MSATFSPFGLVPTKQDSIAAAYPRAVPNALPLTGATFNLYLGQPVGLDVNGYITPITAVTQDIAGVFAGIEYVNAATGGTVLANKYIAGTTFTGFVDSINQITMFVKLYDVDGTIFKVQASGPLPTPNPGTIPNPMAGQQFNLDVVTTVVTNPDGSIFPFPGNTTVISLLGSPQLGYSAACLNPARVAPSVSTGGQFTFWGNANMPGEYLSDQFPTLLVKINRSVKFSAKAPASN